jgi:cellulose synthase/poly-beta-1,6-N-acetylglucosamine synthase-like glycosyltransferase
LLDLLLIPVAIGYLAVVGMLFMYGINFFYLTYTAWRNRNYSIPEYELLDYPPVTVQLPIYNELYVAERLIHAAVRLDYPSERLEIQVLDDSSDETRHIIQQSVKRLQRRGINIHHLAREDRAGYKAGALANGLKLASGEFLAIFDADFIPQADFLKLTLPAFVDPQVGFVQTRWGHTNKNYSLLTYLQSIAVDAHFMVEQYARYRAGFWFNFNGTAGVWRRTTLKDAGGWQADTLTEDLDLSYRAYLKGWKAVYLRDVQTPAELPVSINAYRRQQHRWARGSLECAIKFLPILWRARISTPHKIEASLHLTGYGVHLLLFSLVLLYPIVVLLSQWYPDLISLFGIAFAFNLTAVAPTLFFILAQQHLGNRWWAKLPIFLFISAFGAGMMLNTLRAAMQILTKKKIAFERTPKFGVTDRRDKWTQLRYQLHLDPIMFLEIGFALMNLATAGFALRQGNWAIALYSGFFSYGLFFISMLSLAQAISVWRTKISFRNESHKAKNGILIKPDD